MCMRIHNFTCNNMARVTFPLAFGQTNYWLLILPVTDCGGEIQRGRFACGFCGGYEKT